MEEPGITLEPEERRLLGEVLDWIRRKVEAGEGFSVLMLSLHPTGTKGSKYAFDSVEEGLEACRGELRDELSDASAYALTFDAWVEEDGRHVPAFVARTEVRGHLIARKFLLQYTLETMGDSRKIVTPGEIGFLGLAEGWL